MTAIMEGLIRTTLSLRDLVPGSPHFFFVSFAYSTLVNYCRAPKHSSIFSQSSSVTAVVSQSMISINLSFPSAFRPSRLQFRSLYLRPSDNPILISRSLYPIRQEALFFFFFFWQSHTVLIMYSFSTWTKCCNKRTHHVLTCWRVD